jgi:hypothetical protein
MTTARLYATANRHGDEGTASRDAVPSSSHPPSHTLTRESVEYAAMSSMNAVLSPPTSRPRWAGSFDGAPWEKKTPLRSSLAREGPGAAVTVGFTR